MLPSHSQPEQYLGSISPIWSGRRCDTGKNKEELSLIRDIMICWTYPHIQVYWDQLSEHISTVVTAKATDKQIGSYPDGPNTYYALHCPILEEFAHVILALHQILLAASESVHSSHIYGFKIGEQFCFLRMLAQNSSRSKLCLAFGVLQKIVGKADIHIHNHLITFRKVFHTMDNNMSILSLNFLEKCLACTDLGHILAQLDYTVSKSSLISTRDHLVKHVLSLPSVFYTQSSSCFLTPRIQAACLPCRESNVLSNHLPAPPLSMYGSGEEVCSIRLMDTRACSSKP
jgi:hypothetical protein